jgi:hypothetical protein
MVLIFITVSGKGIIYTMKDMKTNIIAKFTNIKRLSESFCISIFFINSIEKISSKYPSIFFSKQDHSIFKGLKLEYGSYEFFNKEKIKK